jgi:hypothetical protein
MQYPKHTYRAEGLQNNSKQKTTFGESSVLVKRSTNREKPKGNVPHPKDLAVIIKTKVRPPCPRTQYEGLPSDKNY